MDSIFNHEGSIEYVVKVGLFHRALSVLTGFIEWLPRVDIVWKVRKREEGQDITMRELNTLFKLESWIQLKPTVFFSSLYIQVLNTAANPWFYQVVTATSISKFFQILLTRWLYFLFFNYSPISLLPSNQYSRSFYLIA